MPNHAHLVIRPFAGEDLGLLLQGIKGAVARKIQRRAGATGETLWQEESYDRIIRDEEHLARVIAYTGANPEKAGLGHERDWRCWIATDWAAAGWGFEAFGGRLVSDRRWRLCLSRNLLLFERASPRCCSDG